MDLFPTIMYLMDLPIPKDVDGRVLEEILGDSHRKVLFAEEDSVHQVTREDVSSEDKAKIVEELKGLGYM